MNLELRKYAIRSSDWELIKQDNIFKLTRKRLAKVCYEYEYLIFDIDQWSGSHYPIRCELRNGEYREIELKIYDNENN